MIKSSNIIINAIVCICLFFNTACGKSSKDIPDKPIKPVPENPTDNDQSKYEWKNFKIPITPEEDMKWELQTQSDEFNYTATENNKGKEFTDKWIDYYHNDWSGPAPTFWQHNHSSVSGGYLHIVASRPENVETKNVTSGKLSKDMSCTYTGCICSVNKVSYPSYIEAYAKISNSTLASDVWMLSDDETQEIDIIEAYGSDRNVDDNNKSYYGKDRLHLSHHVFIRSPFQDYQPNDIGSWFRDANGTIWRNSFHRIGVYWENPYSLKYYVDGNLVRSIEGKDKIDPKNYTDEKGLNKEMKIIINMEDQSWRAINGLTPTADELRNKEDCTFLVDWIRIYKLVKK